MAEQHNPSEPKKKPAAAAKPEGAKKGAVKTSAKKTTKTKSTRRKQRPTQTTKAAKSFKKAGPQFKTMEDLMTNSVYNFDKLAQQATASGKEQMEAFVESGNLFAKGFESIFKTYISLAQESAEKSSQALKDLMSCKTLDEFSEKQSKIASEGLDDFFNSFIKLSEMSIKLTTDAFEPINDQFSKTTEKIKKAA